MNKIFLAPMIFCFLNSMTMEYNSESLSLLERLPFEIITEHVLPEAKNYDPEMLTLIKHFGYSTTTTDMQKKEYEDVRQEYFVPLFRLCLVNKYCNYLYEKELNKQKGRLLNSSHISHDHLVRYLRSGDSHLYTILHGKLETGNKEKVKFSLCYYLYAIKGKSVERYGLLNEQNSVFSTLQFTFITDTKIICGDNAHHLGVLINNAFTDKENGIFWHRTFFDFLAKNVTDDNTKEEINNYKKCFDWITKQNVHDHGLKINKRSDGDDENWEYTFYCLIGKKSKCKIPFDLMVVPLIKNKKH